MRRLILRAVAGVTLLATGLLPIRHGHSEPMPAAAKVEFNRDIRPILADNCFACHGPDENRRQAELRLDVEQQATADRGGYRAIAAGQPDASELLHRVTADDAEQRMPPPQFGKQLDERQITLLRRWIAEGAKWQEHWSLLPPVRPALPDLTGDTWARNPIDQFVMARLRAEGLTPAAEADPRTLVRRLAFDLTGLPPTADEVAQLENDPSPHAYEHLVDRLLASQHYGERMAIHWLDLVRYADTNGIHGDNHREHAPYRDYVIKSFNDNKPFDQFTIEQLAGDLLPQPDPWQRIASGYNRLNMTTREGGAQAKEYRAKYAADRVRNASSVWLGATLGCAECHDHKFDPYTAKDFYRFAAFFADVQETAVGVQEPTRVPNAEQQNQLAQLDQMIAPLQQALDTQTPELDEALARWESTQADRDADWTALTPTSVSTANGTTIAVHEDGVLQATGANPDQETTTLQFELPPDLLPRITGIRLEVLPDKQLPADGPGRADNGNFVLNELRLTTAGAEVKWSKITASHSQESWPVAHAADGDPTTGWAILDQTGKPNEAVFQTASDLTGEAARQLTASLQQHYGSRHTLGRFRFSVTDAARPLVENVPQPIRKILAAPPETRTDEQRRQLAAHYRDIAPELEETRGKLAELRAKRDKLLESAPLVLVATSGEPRVTRVLPRGNWLDDSGEVVQPGVPAVLRQLETQGRATRLDLAQWLVDPQNPMVARVMVNRLWQLCFGQGLVRTPDDFGAQGAWPTHPRLLDWLAAEFVDSGWDIKHMMKLIVMSSTYRQSSVTAADLRQRDPYNKLLARQNRFRLDAEVIRDSALAISGLLVEQVGGPSVKPYQPAGYWSHLNFPKREYQADKGADQYRRGLYTYWCRTFLHPSMLAFDAPSREECTVERPRSNTPLQALVLLNDPSYVEAARAFAERIVREGGSSTVARLDFAFQQALNRAPSDDERRLLTQLFEQHVDQYRADTSAANQLLKAGQQEVPTDLDSAELAAWTNVARVVFNLHETITRP